MTYDQLSRHAPCTVRRGSHCNRGGTRIAAQNRTSSFERKINMYSQLSMLWTIMGIALSAGAGSAANAADEEFAALVNRLQGEKVQFAQRQQDLLKTRYDLADQPARDAKMSRGK